MTTVRPYMEDTEFTFNNQLELTESETKEIETQLRQQYAANKGLTLEQYEAQQAAERQKYIDDPTLFERELEEHERKYKAEMKELDDEFFKLTGQHFEDWLKEDEENLEDLND